MGLLTILKKLREEEREMRILMLGLDGAGKGVVNYIFELRVFCDFWKIRFCYTVIVPIKRQAYFQFSDKMSLNFVMSLNYKSSKLYTFHENFGFSG